MGSEGDCYKVPPPGATLVLVTLEISSSLSSSCHGDFLPPACSFLCLHMMFLENQALEDLTSFRDFAETSWDWGTKGRNEFGGRRPRRVEFLG
eukprot:1139395-Pelagomonas_calceolata.AAC.3